MYMYSMSPFPLLFYCFSLSLYCVESFTHLFFFSSLPTFLFSFLSLSPSLPFSLSLPLTASMRSKVVSLMTTGDQDSIYSNDDVISCVFLFLESSQTLKKEANITDTVMGEVDTVSQQHLPLSTSC